jgi:glycosyltransferase involved in cell wall biosynthesis
MVQKQLSIVLPMYNPHENWDENLCNSINKLKLLFSDVDFEIVIVNDGSKFNFHDKVENLLVKYKNVRFLEYSQNKGKGFAVKYGVENSNAEYYIYSDYDFPFGCEAVYETYSILGNENCDLVFGKRNKSYFWKLPIKRHVISKVLRIFNYILLCFKPIDTQAGLKGLNNTTKSLLINTKANGFIFEFEFIRTCVKNNCEIRPVNISIAENITFSDFRFKIIFDELRNYIKLFFQA